MISGVNTIWRHANPHNKRPRRGAKILQILKEAGVPVSTALPVRAGLLPGILPRAVLPNETLLHAVLPNGTLLHAVLLNGILPRGVLLFEILQRAVLRAAERVIPPPEAAHPDITAGVNPRTI